MDSCKIPLRESKWILTQSCEFLTQLCQPNIHKWWWYNMRSPKIDKKVIDNYTKILKCLISMKIAILSPHSSFYTNTIGVHLVDIEIAETYKLTFLTFFKILDRFRIRIELYKLKVYISDADFLTNDPLSAVQAVPRLQNKKSDENPFSRHFLKGTSLSEGNYMLKYSKTRG